MITLFRIPDCSHLFCLGSEPHPSTPRTKAKLTLSGVWGTYWHSGQDRRPSVARPRKQPAQKSWKQSSRHGRSYCAWHSGHTSGWLLAASRAPRPSRGPKIAPDIYVEEQDNKTVAEIPGAPVKSLLPGLPRYPWIPLANGFRMLECAPAGTTTGGEAGLIGAQGRRSHTSPIVPLRWLCRGVVS